MQPTLESPYQKFTKDVLIIGVATVLTALSGVIRLPLFTKMLGAYDYGIWKQAEITVALVVGFVGLGLPFAITRFLPAKTNKEEIREEFYSAFCLVFLVALGVSIILIVFANFIAGAFFEGATQIVRITGLLILVGSLNIVLLNLLRAFRQMKRYSVFIIADVYAQIGLIVYLILGGHGLFSIMLGVLAIRVLILVVLFILIKLQIGMARPRFLRIKEYLVFGVPTIFANLANWMVSSGDRYVIAYFLGVTSVGIYSAGYSIGSIVIIFPGVLGFVLSPALSKLYDESRITEVKTHLSYCLKYFLAVAIPFVIGAAILSKPVLTLFSTSEIANEGYFVTSLIAISTLFYGTYTVISHILFAAKKTKIVGLIWVVAAAVNLGLNIVAVPYLGILGAAFTTLISYLLAFSVGIYYSFREFKFPIDLYFIIKSVSASAVMALIIWLMQPQSGLATVLTVILGVIVYGVTLFLLKGFKKEEINFFKRLLKRQP